MDSELNAEMSNWMLPPAGPHRAHRHLAHAAVSAHGDSAKMKLEQEILDE